MVKILISLLLIVTFSANAQTVTITGGTGGSYKLVQGIIPSQDFSVVITDTSTINVGGVVSYPVSDLATTKTSVAGVLTSFTVVDSIPLGVTVTASNLTPSTCASSDGSHFSWVSNGDCQLSYNSPTMRTRIYHVDMVNSIDPSNLYTYKITGTSYATGSLSAYVTSTMASLISGVTPGSASQDAFLTGANYVASSPSGARNTSNFAAAYNGLGSLPGFTAVTFARSSESPGNIYPATLISPHHVIYACHISWVYNETDVWEKNGSFYSSNMVSSSGVGTTDICIGYLNTAISAITPAIILPSNYASYLPSLNITGAVGQALWLPVLTQDYNSGTGGSNTDVISTSSRHIRVEEATLINSTTALFAESAPLNSNRAALWSAIYGGDSSSPLFIPINGSLVLLNSFHSANGGDNYAAYQTQINAVMNSLANAANESGTAGCPTLGNCSYAIGTINLSGFTSY